VERNKTVGILIGLLFVFSTLAYLARGAPRVLPTGTFQGVATATIIKLYDRWLVPAGVNVDDLNVTGSFQGYVVVSGGENVLKTLLERNAPNIMRSALVRAHMNLNGEGFDLNLPAYVYYTRHVGDLIPIVYYISIYNGRVERAVAFDTMQDLTGQ